MTFDVQPLTLRQGGVVLEPLSLEHADGLERAAADGELWNLPVTSVPEPGGGLAYVEHSIEMRQQGRRVAFAVVEEASGEVIGSTSFHDMIPEARRVEIGYTWYARRFHRTHVNAVCKLMLLEHAFGTLDANVVGWRTDGENFASQAAIEALGARFDGRIRGFRVRKDGSPADAVLYSMTADEWPAARDRLFERLAAFAGD